MDFEVKEMVNVTATVSVKTRKVLQHLGRVP